MNDYNTVHYVIPKCTKMFFCIPPLERDFSIKLLEGTARVHLDRNRLINLPLRQEYQLSEFQCSTFAVKSISKCDFIFRGNHYVIYAKVEIGDVRKNLLGLSLKDDSFVFVLEESAQIQIFVDEVSQVKIEAMRGSPGIFGSSLIRNKKYGLIPNSSVLVNSLTNEAYTIGVEGQNRRIKVLLLQEISFAYMKSVHARLHSLRIKAMDDNCAGPVVLVIGQQNVGKTSFCHFLLNKAVDEGMNPVYIDLDVCRNQNVIPGAMSLTEIKSQRHVIRGYSKHMQNILQFGSYHIHSNNVKFYYSLVKRMGELLRTCQTDNTTHYSGVVIDTCGFLGKDNSAIQCILDSFKIDLVIVIGDKNYYRTLKSTILNAIQSDFIPQSENIEIHDQIKEIKLRDTILRKYFYGKVYKPLEFSVFEVKILNIKIYRTVFMSPNDNKMYSNHRHFNLEPVPCVPAIEYYVLGVSQARNMDEYSPTTEVKYFVCFTKVDMIKKTVSVLSPESVPFSEILIIGEIRMPLD